VVHGVRGRTETQLLPTGILQQAFTVKSTLFDGHVISCMLWVGQSPLNFNLIKYFLVLFENS